MRALLGLGLAIVVTWTMAAALARAGHQPILVYNGAFAIAFVLYVAAAAIVLRPNRHRQDYVACAAGTLGWDHALAVVLGVALVLRLVLLTTHPALSDDLYRYVWDGKVASAGINPYRYTPEAPELAFLRDPHWTAINHKSQHTPYPPAAQLVFAATYRIAPDSVKAQQVVAILADLLVIGALLALLAALRLPPERVLLYAWSPIPVLHFAHSAHNDPVMLAALLAALVLVTGSTDRLRRRIGSGLALAFAALVKLVPLLLIPVLVPRWRVAGTLACLLGLAIGAVPYLALGPAALAGLGAEAGEAVFNDSVHFLLMRLLAPVIPHAKTATSLLTLAALGGTALALAWKAGEILRSAQDDRATAQDGRGEAGQDGRGRFQEHVARSATILLGLALLLNAVVEPWYLAWMLPFVALFLQPGSGRWPFAASPMLGWLWLSGAVQLTDLTYLGPDFARWWPLIRLIEYGPLAAVLGWSALRAQARVPSSSVLA